MITENLSTLKIHKLTQEQYDRELANNTLDENAIYLTPENITLTQLGVTATATELNVLDGVTATTTELNYVDGVTSSVQEQLNNKQATIVGAATTITDSNLTTNRALISNGSGKVAASEVTSTELGYLDGVTSNIQSQIDGKLATSDFDNAITNYYTKTQIDNYEFISVDDIDAICGTSIQVANGGVTF